MIPSTKSTAPEDPHPAPPAAAWPDVPGYQVVGELGRGGMGVVYKARQSALNRFVAIKMMNTDEDDVDDRIRFLGEAEAVASIQHPNVVQIHAFGQAEDRPYLVMEYVAGGSLAALLKECPRLPHRAAAALVSRVARGVQAAHDAGIIHRDLKPANILLSGDEPVALMKEDSRSNDDPFVAFPTVSLAPGGLKPKVTDFGLARGMHGATVSQPGVAVGTPAYMAPEQARGQAALLGAATDVHGLGAVLFECLTGRLPFEADTAEKMLRLIADRDAPRVRDHAPSVPLGLDQIVDRCLAKHPADRYPTADALADDLDRFLADEPVSVATPGLAERVAYQVRKHPAYVLGALSVVLGAFGVVTTGLWFRADARRVEAEAALHEAHEAQQRVVAERTHAEEAKADAEFAHAVRATEQAVRELRSGNLARARQLLVACPDRFRAWEWHYASHLLGRATQDARDPGLAHRWRHLFYPPTEVVLPEGGPPARLALSNDGRDLALLADDTLSIVATRSAVTLASVRVPAGCRELAFSADGSRVTVVAPARSAREWEWRTAAALRPSTAKFPAAAADLAIDATALAVRRDGEQAATGGVDGVVRVCDAQTGANTRRLAAHRGRVTGLAFHPDGTRLASVGSDGVVRVWDVRTGVDVLTLEVSGAATAVSWSPDGARLVVATGDLVRIFDATPPRE